MHLVMLTEQLDKSINPATERQRKACEGRPWLPIANVVTPYFYGCACGRFLSRTKVPTTPRGYRVIRVSLELDAPGLANDIGQPCRPAILELFCCGSAWRVAEHSRVGDLILVPRVEFAFFRTGEVGVDGIRNGFVTHKMTNLTALSTKRYTSVGKELTDDAAAETDRREAQVDDEQYPW